MKTRFECADAPASAARRQLITAAALGAGVAVLPAAPALAAAIKQPPVSMASIDVGYATLDAVFKQGVKATLVDAISVRPSGGNFLLRVASAVTTVPMALSAFYTSTLAHCFWQAWNTAGLLQRSPPIAIRWDASGTQALPLQVTVGGATLNTAIAARNGIYVVIVPGATQKIPAWSDLALRPQSTGGVEYALIQRSTGRPVAFPFAVFEVQDLGAVG